MDNVKNLATLDGLENEFDSAWVKMHQPKTSVGRKHATLDRLQPLIPDESVFESKGFKQRATEWFLSGMPVNE